MSSQTDDRLLELSRWSADQLTQIVGHPIRRDLEAIPSDAGCRRYFRAYSDDVALVTDDKSWIVVDASPEYEDCRSFVTIANSWRCQGLRTPAVFAVDYDRGYMLLEDFGNEIMQYSLDEKTVSPLYEEALKNLLILQKVRINEVCPLPEFDAIMLNKEMELFPQWCLKELLGMTIGQDTRALLDDLFHQLTASAQAQPQIPVHRDYHSRNLMVLPEGLGIIDFQGAVMGPATYDLVSLLRDCYIDWSQSQVYRWMESFRMRSDVLAVHDQATVTRWFDWIGVQRHVKVLGIFARLSLRDGKSDYLKELPRVFAYLLWVCDRYPELARQADWLRSDIQSRFAKLAWWYDYQLNDE
ncbi:MAG: phosphotransferase [Endozoicomonadaceae bacterium]|nr:phosphotransferase [Endozoicomonadaceae bacterium]